MDHPTFQLFDGEGFSIARPGLALHVISDTADRDAIVDLIDRSAGVLEIVAEIADFADTASSIRSLGLVASDEARTVLMTVNDGVASATVDGREMSVGSVGAGCVSQQMRRGAATSVTVGTVGPSLGWITTGALLCGGVSTGAPGALSLPSDEGRGSELADDPISSSAGAVLPSAASDADLLASDEVGGGPDVADLLDDEPVGFAEFAGFEAASASVEESGASEHVDDALGDELPLVDDSAVNALVDDATEAADERPASFIDAESDSRLDSPDNGALDDQKSADLHTTESAAPEVPSVDAGTQADSEPLSAMDMILADISGSAPGPVVLGSAPEEAPPTEPSPSPADRVDSPVSETLPVDSAPVDSPPSTLPSSGLPQSTPDASLPLTPAPLGPPPAATTTSFGAESWFERVITRASDGGPKMDSSPIGVVPVEPVSVGTSAADPAPVESASVEPSSMDSSAVDAGPPQPPMDSAPAPAMDSAPTQVDLQIAVPNGSDASTNSPSEPIAAPPAAEQIEGTVCPLGHVNNPIWRVCGSCGSSLAGCVPGMGERPAVGRLLFSNGLVEPVDAALVLGRYSNAGSGVPLEAGERRVDLEADRSVSRRQLRVWINDWDVWIEDLTGKGKSYLELSHGRVALDKPRQLAHDTVVAFGALSFRFVSAGVE